ncbi:MAG: aminodeoxychorismate/anthranilate synthase component II [Parvibaculum sp.]|nr:aminodeoxychorismate/anthranilate synthase component II [Parvibaculum sp.]
MILLIDNYDSFVHNLARYVGEIGHASEVIRNDVLSPDDIIAKKPRAIILSPGPCGPAEAGMSVPLVRAAAAANIPLLGVCLGHQCIAAAFSDHVHPIEPMHGKASAIHHRGHALFEGMPSPFMAARYHSLIVSLAPASPLDAIAHLADGTLMALAHRDLPIIGVQFHPESVLTEHGHLLLTNFLKLTDVPAKVAP